jgi:hypothetical protein
MSPLGNFDSGKTIINFAGLLFNISTSIALAILIATLVKGTLLSWILSTVVLIFLGSATVKSGIFSLLLFSSHMESFSRGILKGSDVLYFLYITVFSLYASSKIILLRRWS